MAGGRGEPTELELEVDVLDLGDVALPVDRTRVPRLLRWVLEAEDKRGSWSVTIVLTDDEHLRALHRDFMGIDENTDVMTFPFDEDDGVSGGEIVVSTERAVEQGPEHGLSPAQEVDFLIVHGLLHLCGWDDADPEARRRMHERQTALLAGFAGVNPAPPA